MKKNKTTIIADKDLRAKTYSDKEDAAENKQVTRKKIFKGKSETSNVNKKDGMRPGYQKQVEDIATRGRLKAQKKQGMW